MSNEILDRINYPSDLKQLNIQEKQKLAEEIRQYLLEIVSKTGGHLASNLGVVELTIAMHSVYNCPKDKIIWDVGHQTYVHKILTGRKEQLKTLRKLNGISGFPKVLESDYDNFNTGHSSTAISAALGLAMARDLLGEKRKIVAVIGDGALTGGMALEALNNAGSSKTNITVILNDNEMSISKNVGGLTTMLTNLRTKKWYTKSNKAIKHMVKRIPLVGSRLVLSIKKIKNATKRLIINNMFFEDLGFTYLGPVDGHNIAKLEEILKESNKLTGPVLIHVITKKGKGYKPAEETPDKFHGVSAFDIETGKSLVEKKQDYSSVFGEKLIELANKDEKVVAITPAMSTGSGLVNFAKQFPNRFFDVGIAEQHALCLAGGMAKGGLKPFIPIYSSFLQRGYDQIIHDICLQKLPVVICIDRAGIVGADGETHQGIMDLSFLKSIPNLTIMAPKDFNELRNMMEFAHEYTMPIAIRYPRGGEEITFEQQEQIQLGKSEILRVGKDLTIVAIGKMVSRAANIADDLQKYGIQCDVINARFLKPLDINCIYESVNMTRKLVTIEDNVLVNGMSYSIINGLKQLNLNEYKLLQFGYPDKFIEHGSVNELEKIYGLDYESILTRIKEEIL